MTDEEIKEYWRTAYCNEKYKKEELEKEIAELKNKYGIARKFAISFKRENAKLKKEKGCETCTKFDEVKLTKAIELLKKFVRLENCTLDYDDIKEAEQFLSEMENEN